MDNHTFLFVSFTVHFTNSLWSFPIISRVVWYFNFTDIVYNCQICIFVDLCLKNYHTLTTLKNDDYCDGVSDMFFVFFSIEMFTFWWPLRSLNKIVLFYVCSLKVVVETFLHNALTINLGQNTSFKSLVIYIAVMKCTHPSKFTQCLYTILFDQIFIDI